MPKIQNNNSSEIKEITNDINNNKKKKETQDEIGKLYKKISFFEKFSEIIFYVNLILLIPSIINSKFQNLFFAINIVLNISYIIIIKCIDMYLKNHVDVEHRRTFIKNSLNANITEKTIRDLYYNNDEKESIKRMGLNCFESVFFTKFIANKMLLQESLKVIIVLLLYIILLTQINNEKILLFLISQTFFTIEYLFKFLKYIYFKTQLQIIYDEIYDIFITSPPKEEKTLIAKILDTTMNYECLKHFCKISLSSRIFTKYNPILSEQWDIINNKKN